MIRNWKKQILILALTIPVVLSGCGDDDDDDGPSGIPGSKVRIVKVDVGNEAVTIKNFGTTEIDISNYQWCSLFKYGTLSSLTTSNGDLSLATDETVTLTGWMLNDDASDVGLYKGTDFESAEDMVDFMQFGSANNGREPVAVTKGIWGEDDFVAGNGPFEYTGDGTEDGVDFWK